MNICTHSRRPKQELVIAACFNCLTGSVRRVLMPVLHCFVLVKLYRIWDHRQASWWEFVNLVKNSNRIDLLCFIPVNPPMDMSCLFSFQQPRLICSTYCRLNHVDSWNQTRLRITIHLLLLLEIFACRFALMPYVDWTVILSNLDYVSCLLSCKSGFFHLRTFNQLSIGST